MGMDYCVNQNEYQQISSAQLELALAHGAKLDDEGLLFIILSRHHEAKSAFSLTQSLLHRFSSLPKILEAPHEEMTKIDGLSRSAVLELKQIKHFLNAVSRVSIANMPILDCYDKLVEFCKCQFGASNKEQFHTLLLNKRHELIHHECLQTGTLDHVTVYPREVLKLAITHSASFLILAHNHPFGKAKPSNADIIMTRQLMHLAAGLGIGIIEHLILAENQCFSFLNSGLMKSTERGFIKNATLRPINNWR